MFIYVYCSVVTQGKNESGLLTILAAVPVMRLFCACIGRHTVLHKITVPEHYVFIEALCLIWIYVAGDRGSLDPSWMQVCTKVLKLGNFWIFRETVT